MDAPGFFGKLPSHGDFINRRLSRGFLETWDGWMQSAVAASKAVLGDEWLDTYLTSPIYNFVLQPGVCGRRGYAGILMPSVDRVGRYFPLTVVSSMPGLISPLQLAAANSDWFDRATDLAMEALNNDDFTLDEFDAGVEALGDVISVEDDMALSDFSLSLPAQSGVCVPLDELTGAAGSVGRLADGLIGAAWRGLSVWWSTGSEQVAGSLLVCPGLPSHEAYTDFLDGNWRDEFWSFVDANVSSGKGAH